RSRNCGASGASSTAPNHPAETGPSHRPVATTGRCDDRGDGHCDGLAAAHRAGHDLGRAEEKARTGNPLRADRPGASLPDCGEPADPAVSTGSELDMVLGGLERASRDRLARQWQEYFGAPPPPRTSRSLLVRAVAYKMQERALGGLSPAT